MRDFTRVESISNQIEHLNELAEDKDAMAAINNLFQKFIKKIQLGGYLLASVRRKTKQPQIATGLAKPE